MKLKFNGLSWLLIAVGICLPFLWVTIFKRYHPADVAFFRDWSVCLHQSWRTIYLDCSTRIPNYPTMGIFWSAGILTLLREGLGISDPAIADRWFRYVLAVFESGNFLLLVWLFHLSQFRQPVAIALGIMLIPSTWAGAAIWGQIDHVALFFLLGAITPTLAYWRDLDHQTNSSEILWVHWLYCLIIPLSTTLYILTKQIALFSFPFLLALLLITIYKLKVRHRRAGLVQFLVLLTVLIVGFRYLDSLMMVRSSYLGSSFISVWSEGTGHGNGITGNGTNLWLLLGESWQDAHAPLFAIGSNTVKPYTLGIVSYSLLLFFLFQSAFKTVRQEMAIAQLRKASDAITLFYFCCFFHGVSWLGFSTLLTGIHDRHPYNAYIFLLIALAYYGLQEKRWQGPFRCFSGFIATLYGLFIFATLRPVHPLLFAVERNAFIATLQVVWLMAMLVKWVDLCRDLRLKRWRLKHFG
ncbi:MAG: hypothetical protein AAGG51_07480 [Cyanobacteria bacterium P01_G01_bin.54]